MAANIDSMAYCGNVPWHRLGTRLANPMTAEEAITAGGLDWEVVKEPLYFDERKILVKDRYVTRRSDRLTTAGGGYLGCVGRDYRPLLNREAFAFLNPLRIADKAVFHTVGAIDEGRRVWLLAKLPGEIRVVGDDITEKFLLLSNSHDGTSAVRVMFTGVRVVCQNTLNLALRDAGGLSIRHHADVHERVKEAYKLLGIVNEAYEAAAVSMRAMAKVHLTSNRLKGYFETLMPLPIEDEEQRLRVQQRHRRWEELFETGIGNSTPGVRGTVWAAYNGVTQWVDRESYTSRQKNPLKTIWFGQGRLLKERAFSQAEKLLSVSLN